MRNVVLLKSTARSQGGLEKHAQRIADAFIARGDKVTCLTAGSKKTFLPATFRLEQFDCFVQKYLKQNSADIVFGMDRNRFQTHIRAGNGVHAAYLESRELTEGKFKALFRKVDPFHRKILEIEKTALEHPLLKKVFTNSHMVKNEILRFYNTDPNKIQVIHNGVEWDEMAPSFAKQQFNNSQYHFLFVGNGFLRKGLDQLLVALAKMGKKEVKLLVVGKDKNLPFYQKRVFQLGLASQVQFLGQVANITPFYEKADCLVIPSFYDPFANVTVEALAMGLFVISSKKNGGHEILTSENGAIIEDLFNLDSMVSALEIALKNPKTKNSAHSIRQSVKHLDFSNQLSLLMEGCE